MRVYPSFFSHFLIHINCLQNIEIEFDSVLVLVTKGLSEVV